MRNRYLKPVELQEKQILKVYHSIRDYLKETFYKQLQYIYKETFNKNLVYNSISTELQNYFKEGRLVYKNGIIRGRYNASIVRQLKKIGAVYDTKKRYFTISRFPNELLNIVYTREKKVKEFIVNTDYFIDNYLQNLEESVKYIDISFDDTIQNYTQQIVKNFDNFGIKPTITTKSNKYLNEVYTNNTKLYIKDFMEKDTLALREILKGKILTGESNKSIAEYIQHNYYTTQKKSLFLARQESSILLSEYSKEQYLRNGVNRYKWSSSRDERVRETHRKLDGTIQDFGNPPISEENGARNNPGMAFGCYSKDTELLTKEGFKLIKDVEIGEEVATINPETKQWEWGICSNKVKHYKANIFNIHNNIFNVNVSEDHTFFYYKKKYNGKQQISNSDYPIFTTGINSLARKNTIFLATTNKYIGSDVKTICNIPTEIFCQFMGFYLSDGNADKRTNNCIHISQQNNQWMYDIFKDYLHIDKGKEKLYIYNKDLYDIVAPLGYCNEKYIPAIIKDLDAKYIRVFLDAFVKCDGHNFGKTNGFNGKTNMKCYNQYYTTSPRMMADLVECIYKTNMSCSIYKYNRKGQDVKFRNGIYKLNYDLYTIQEMKTLNRDLISCKIDKEEYNDFVYDIEVNKNHTLLIKDGKSIHWNSNCRCVAIPIIDTNY